MNVNIRKLLRLIRLIVRKLTKNSIVISSAINLCTYMCLQRGEVRTFTPWTNAPDACPPHCNPHWRNHVFKVGVVQFLGLGYYTEQNTDGIPSFVHCSLQLRKKLEWSVQILGVRTPTPNPVVVAPLVTLTLTPDGERWGERPWVGRQMSGDTRPDTQQGRTMEYYADWYTGP